MKGYPFIFAVLAAVLVTAPYSVAEEKKSDALGPHGGKIVQGEFHQFEVKVTPQKKHVDVYTLKATKPAPRSMSMTLVPAMGIGEVVELKSADLGEPLPKYQGELSPSMGSYVGIELRFQLGPKSKQVLRLEPPLGH